MTKKRLRRPDENSKKKRSRDSKRPPSFLVRTWLERIPAVTWLALALVASTLVATTAIGDNDYGFHLRLGSEIARSGPPRIDSHSYTAPGASYPDHEWLSQLFWYQAYRVAGDRGMVVLQALLVAAALVLVALTIRRRSIAVALFAVDAVLLLGLHHIQMRPHILSWVFTALLGFLLDRRLFYAVPPLLLVWSNCHGSVPLAVVWVCFALFEEFLATREKKLLVFAAVSALVPLANPYGIGVYTLFFEIMGHTSFIGEWKPYTSETGAFWVLLLVFAIATAGLASFRPWSPFDLARVGMLALFAFRSSRNGVVAALYLAPLFMKWFARGRQKWPRTAGAASARDSSRRDFPLEQLVAMGLALVPIAVLAAQLRRGEALQFRLEHEQLPIASVEFLERHELPGRIFNDYNFGGWLLWKGWPKYPVFVDGRTEVYKGKILDEYLSLSRAKGDWKKAFDRWGVQTVLIRPERELARALLADPDWGLAYFDYNSVVYARKGSAPGVRRLEVVSPWGHREGKETGRRDTALDEMNYLLAENQRFFGGWKIRAFLLAKKGDWAGARDSLRQYLELHPEGKDVKDAQELVGRLVHEGSWP